MVERKPTPIAYLRHTGAYGEPLLRFWQDVYYPWAFSNNLLGQARFGICHEDPSITAPENCRYDACVELPDGVEPTGPALKTTLPGGKYAALHFQGTAAEMVNGWTSLLRDWLPQSGLQLDGRPNFEHYPITSTYDHVTGVMSCEICIPVTRL